MEMNIEKFDPTTQQLNELVAKSKEIKEVDIDDKNQMEIVKRARIDLKNARVAITKRGKELREDALKFQRAVIEKEKELIAIIEPEETRLQSLEEEVKNKKIRAERIEKLPWRKEKLEEVDANIDDETILSLDDTAFQILLNEKAAEKLRKIEDEQRAKEAEEKRKRDIEEAAENAKREAEEKAKRDAEIAEQKHKDEIAKIEREAKERIERETREKEEAIAKEKEEQEKLEKKKKYQEWLAKNNYNETIHYLRNEGGIITMYQKIDTFKL